MIRVFISYGHGFMPDAVQIAIVNEFPGDVANSPSRMIARFDGDILTWEQVDPMVVTKPTLTLTDDMARALMEELTRHYHGADDSRALRRDYDAERKRVDDLTGHLAFALGALVSREAAREHAVPANPR